MGLQILHQEEGSSNPLTSDREGSIVIRMGLRGVRSVEILTDDATTEERLTDFLRSVQPVLEMLNTGAKT